MCTTVSRRKTLALPVRLCIILCGQRVIKVLVIVVLTFRLLWYMCYSVRMNVSSLTKDLVHHYVERKSGNYLRFQVLLKFGFPWQGKGWERIGWFNLPIIFFKSQDRYNICKRSSSDRSFNITSLDHGLIYQFIFPILRVPTL